MISALQDTCIRFQETLGYFGPLTLVEIGFST